jgi:anti-anti-sigma factor
MERGDESFTVEVEDGTVRPCGELDLATVTAVRDALRAQVAAHDHVTLDLGGLRFLDTSGLRLVLETVDAARQDRFSFSVLPGSAEIQRLFELAGVTHLVPFADGNDSPRR